VSEEDLFGMAQNFVTDVLVKHSDGISKLQLRLKTHEAAEAKVGAEIARAIVEEFFGSDPALTRVLDMLDYSIKGAQVIPKA
jgi:hypothetical protein